MKILVRGTNWIGDAVMTIPALRELRRIFPTAKISLHTRKWAQGIFQDASFIDEIIAFEKTGSKIKDSLLQSKQIKNQNFDLAVLFTNSFESALVYKLAKIPRRFGFAKEGRSFLLTDSVAMPDWKNERHEVFYYLSLIAEIENAYFGTKTVLENAPVTKLEISDERKIEARKILEKNGVDLSKKTIALGVGSTNSRAKRWQAESYAKLNDFLQNELNYNVVLVGAFDEMEVSNKVAELSNKKPIILTGKTDLSEAVGVLSEIDLLVSNDMGLAHVSAAVGTKTLVIFGPTNEKTTQPIGSEIIRKNVDCAPCMKRDCPIDHRCMTQISPEEVFEKARKMLEV
ncbi:MAG TPA: lipopolysaccharide heptosyltransferase II [Pyrinomonadaceae bacterium]|nr:lipopolysaccharide heptosyltransferase II [Pyrinomonadaceae bacterium]